MRILYTHDIFSRQARGGISRYFVELIRHLDYQQAEIQVLAGTHWNGHLRELDGHASLVGNYRTPSRFSRGYQRYVNRRRQDGSSSRGPHSIAHHTYYSFTRPLKPARLVATIHDLIPERFPREFGWKARLLSAAKRRTCLQAERILSNSQTTKNDLVEHFGISPDRIDVTYLGNSLVRYATDSELAPYSFPYLLYVGSREGYKNCQTLWRAFASSPRLKQDFRLVCFGGGSFSASEKNLLVELGISEQVIQSGGEDRTLANHYRHASAFVYPSIYEGFGIPPIEAMTFGCPVVASTGGSIPEIVDSAGLYFDPQDEEALAHCLETVLYDESVRADLQIEMKTRVPMFRWEETARLTQLAYEKVAA